MHDDIEDAIAAFATEAQPKDRFLFTPADLVGRPIKMLFKFEDGVEEWCEGRVLKQDTFPRDLMKAKFTVRWDDYEGEDGSYALFTDMQLGHLHVLEDD